jgi:hypothetical protein
LYYVAAAVATINPEQGASWCWAATPLYGRRISSAGSIYQGYRNAEMMLIAFSLQCMLTLEKLCFFITQL